MAMIKGHKFPGGRSVMPAPKVSMPKAPPPKNGGETVDVRAIDNGYLIEKRSWTDGPKGYRSETKTIFSPTKPELKF